MISKLSRASINPFILLQLCGMSLHFNPRISLEELTEVFNIERLFYMKMKHLGNHIHLALEAAS